MMTIVVTGPNDLDVKVIMMMVMMMMLEIIIDVVDIDHPIIKIEILNNNKHNFDNK